jgi:hypothetical protein
MRLETLSADSDIELNRSRFEMLYGETSGYLIPPVPTAFSTQFALFTELVSARQ